MAQTVRYGPDVDALGYQEGGVQVPECMEGEWWQPCLGCLCAQDSEQVLRFHRSGEFAGEDEIVFWCAEIEVIVFCLLSPSVLIQHSNGLCSLRVVAHSSGSWSRACVPVGHYDDRENDHATSHRVISLPMS